MNYKEQLLHPFWQKKRLEVLERDKFTCQKCQDDNTTLNVHHLQYNKGCMAWEYNNENLVSLCCICHDIIEDLKKETEYKCPFDQIKILKTDHWKHKHKAMFVHDTYEINMYIYDINNNLFLKFFLGKHDLEGISELIKKPLNFV